MEPRVARQPGSAHFEVSVASTSHSVLIRQEESVEPGPLASVALLRRKSGYRANVLTHIPYGDVG